MIIPSDVTPGMQQFCREVETILTNLQTRNSTLDGRRVIDAGDGVSPQDYITLRQMKKHVDTAIGTAMIAQDSSTASGALATGHIIFGVSGTPAVATDVGFPVQMTVNGTFTDWFMSMGTAGTGSETTVDVKKNGTTIFTSKPSLSIGVSSAMGSGFADASFAKGDIMSYDVVAIGVTTAGDKLSLQLNFKAA
jgi:alkylated DNA nucleotide flippase Atl1